MKFNGFEYDYKVSAAGRVNLIGEHVDYCGGKVLPAALTLCNTVYVRPNGTDKINLSWTDLPDKYSLDIHNLEQYRTEKHAKYQAGSAYMWQQAGHKLVGCDLLYDCTVPFGSGLSSSAAIEVSTIAAVATAAGEKFDPVEVALCAQKAEHVFAGVICGIMDQYISACGKKGCAVLLDCKTLEREYVPVELKDAEIVIINCKKPHNLVESKYNERRAETEQALALLQTKANISCLAELSPEKFNEISSVLEGNIYKRAKHVVEECARVHAAADAMKAGDAVRLGELFNASHTSLRDLYEVTGKELDALAAAAQKHPACYGSRMTGAGFGGCTVSLVKKAEKDDFVKFVAEEYKKATGYTAEFYSTALGDGIIVEGA